MLCLPLHRPNLPYRLWKTCYSSVCCDSHYNLTLYNRMLKVARIGVFIDEGEARRNIAVYGVSECLHQTVIVVVDCYKISNLRKVLNFDCLCNNESYESMTQLLVSITGISGSSASMDCAADLRMLSRWSYVALRTIINIDGNFVEAECTWVGLVVYQIHRARKAHPPSRWH